MFNLLERINSRPKPFEYYTASELWADEHTSKQMLKYHLKEDVDLSSRNIKFIDRSVDWIVSHFKIKEGTKIADFGCGPGLYTSRLARTQADVTGIDFSENSIEYAKDKAAKEDLSIKYVHQNYLEYETDDNYDLIIMIMCDFCALSSDQRKRMLDKFHRFLKPDGAVLLDAYTLNAFVKREEGASYGVNFLDGFWSPNKYYGFMNTFVYDTEKVILDKYTLIESKRTRTVYNWLQYFTPESLKKEFTDYGFAVDDLYSDVAGTPFSIDSDEMAIIARRQ